ncbi:hypothetical protein BC826DRAFT_737223 [Russula brevipes]|nr:hypothetical protein BC826DRAFT_737223 [Russula brevipes]
MNGPRHVQFMYETGRRLSSQWIPIDIQFFIRHAQHAQPLGIFFSSVSLWSGLPRPRWETQAWRVAKVLQAFETFNISSDMHITFDPIVLFEVTSPQPNATTVNVSVGGQLPQTVPNGGGTTTVLLTLRRAVPTCILDHSSSRLSNLDAPTPQSQNFTQVQQLPWRWLPARRMV